MYPSVEMLLVSWLAEAFEDASVAVQTPPDLQGRLPFVTVRRIGGRDDVLTLDIATIDVDWYDETWAGADEGARQVRVALRTSLLGSTVETDSGRATVARVDTTGAPAWRPTTDPGLHRCGGSYRIVTHSRSAA
jgi:hypothetical protein